MSLALSDDHQALAEVARKFLADRDARGAARATLESGGDRLPAFWSELCELGWPGLHLPEEVGGQGLGLLELAIVVEELGRVIAPGPFLPAVIASAAIAELAKSGPLASLQGELASGQRIASVAFEGSVTLDSRGRLGGTLPAVLAGALADLILVPVDGDLVVVESRHVEARSLAGLDPGRGVAEVVLRDVVVDAALRLVGGVEVAARIARVLAAAEATGGARACLETAVGYAKLREQFGRPIGSFQAVKHHCAEMLVKVELAGAATWEAARSAHDGSGALAAAAAAAQALPAFQWCAQKTIQILGGIGYTWEHDAHLYLRRSAALAALFGASEAPAQVFERTRAGARVAHAIELPPEAEQKRSEARAFRAKLDALPHAQQRPALVDSGYLVPHWPEPWGRAAGAAEQLVIDQELDGVDLPQLGIGSWVVLTLVQCGSAEQKERWIRPSLLGEMRWCQLFSEPGAGSDAAAIKTRATRVEGGWRVSGQKVWTSDARGSNMGLATVRTGPDVPKHAGVSMLAIDMTARGVTVRPLREITGETLFNEVFFDDVFVPDRDVVGQVNQGWAVARATLGNERVSIGGNRGRLDNLAAEDLVELALAHAPRDAGVARDVGRLIAEQNAMRSLNLRLVMRALAGGPPGPEGSVTKLLSAEHAQRVAELGMAISGSAGVSGSAARVTHSYLFSRCLTIAGGTSEIVRNLIAERILGLPRDPLLK